MPDAVAHAVEHSDLVVLGISVEGLDEGSGSGRPVVVSLLLNFPEAVLTT